MGEIGLKNCDLFDHCRQKNKFIHPIFTQPWKALLVQPGTHLFIHDVDWEDADRVVGLHGAGGSELVEGALGHAREHRRHRIIPSLE